MAFQASGIPSFNFGTFREPVRPRSPQPRRRVVVKGPSETAGLAGIDRNYEQQIDEREQKQALELIGAQKATPKVESSIRPAAAPVMAMPERKETLAEAIERGAVYQPGRDRNESLIAFAGELMDLVPDDSGRVMLSKAMVAQLPGFVSGMSGFRGAQNVYVQREKSESGAEVLGFYEQGDDGAVLPLLNNGAPVRLRADLMVNAAKISRLGRDRVNQLEDQKAAIALAKAKAESKADKTQTQKVQDADGNEVFLEKDPASGEWREVKPMGMARMGRQQAEDLANDMAKNAAGWLSSDADDFARWGGRKAFVYDATQRLMQGESPEEIMRQSRVAGRVDPLLEALKAKRAQVDGNGLGDVVTRSDDKVVSSESGMDRGMLLFRKPEPGEALGPKVVEAAGEVVEPVVEAVQGVKDRAAMNLLRTRLPVIQAAIRRGNMTKRELAEAVQVLDLLPKSLQDEVKRLMPNNKLAASSGG